MHGPQTERAPALIRYEVVLQATDVPDDDPHALGRRDLDRRRKESVFRHGDNQLALRRRCARHEQRAARRKTQSPHDATH
jgi:hypothetical protein